MALKITWINYWVRGHYAVDTNTVKALKNRYWMLIRFWLNESCGQQFLFPGRKHALVTPAPLGVGKFISVLKCTWYANAIMNNQSVYLDWWLLGNFLKWLGSTAYWKRRHERWSQGKIWVNQLLPSDRHATLMHISWCFVVVFFYVSKQNRSFFSYTKPSVFYLLTLFVCRHTKWSLYRVFSAKSL